MGNNSPKHLPGWLEYLWLCSFSDHTEFAKFLCVQHPRVPGKTGGSPGEARAGITHRVLLMTLFTWSPSTSPADFTKRGNVLQQITFPTVAFNCSCPLDRRFYFYCGLIEAVPKISAPNCPIKQKQANEIHAKEAILVLLLFGLFPHPMAHFPISRLGKTAFSSYLWAWCYLVFVPK